MDVQRAGRSAGESIGVNLALSSFKLVSGLWGHSMAMVADAVHSLSDAFTSVVVLFALKLSAREEDSDHEYGHERFESLAALLLAVLLGITGVGIGHTALTALLHPVTVSMPGILPMVAAAVSIAVKELLFRRTRATALAVHSDALLADAWHHRSDALSSVGSLIGIGAARCGVPWADAVCGLAICGCILWTAVEIFIGAARKLTDRALPGGQEKEIRACAMEVKGVETVDLLKTRVTGAHSYVEIEIGVDGDMSLRDAHAIAETVHERVERAFPDVMHCMVHVNPTRH